MATRTTVLNRKLNDFTRKNNKHVKQANKRIDKRTVLYHNFNYKLPSSRHAARLNTICEEAKVLLEEAKERYLKASDIKAKSLLLKEAYIHEPERLKELPHLYLNDNRIKKLVTELEEAEALYEALAQAYKNRTGKKHSTKASRKVNNPLDMQG